MKDCAYVNPRMDDQIQHRDIIFRVRHNQNDIILSLAYGGHGELMRWVWIPLGE